jgi:hypothetical protein
MTEIAEQYHETRKALHEAVAALVDLSVSLAGSPSEHGRQYWSSILLAKMTLTAMTLDRIVPERCSSNAEDLWDLTAVAALVRVLAENYLLLHWLCVETEDEALWQFRITAMTLVDNRSRYRMTAEVEGETEPADFQSAQQALGETLSAMPLFQALEAGCQKDLLRGNKSPYIHDDVVESLDLDFDRHTFRRLYRYLSAFVHTGTTSFFRMEAHGRGNGEFNDYDASAMTACAGFAHQILRGAASGIERIYTGTEATGRQSPNPG